MKTPATIRPCQFCETKFRSIRKKSEHLRTHEASGEAVRLKKSVESMGTVFMDWEIVVPVSRVREYLLAMGNLIRDHQLIGQKLKALHLDESAYHGTLQVVLTALYRMQTLVATMIRQCEGS